jgi:hypothetical protein
MLGSVELKAKAKALFMKQQPGIDFGEPKKKKKMMMMRQ